MKPTTGQTVSLATQVPNPAQLSSALSALFPVGVVASELQTPASSEWLSDAERDSVRHCHEKRIQDFTAGRLCARRALQEFGIGGFSLLAAADRQPLWPPALVGSITHTEGYCAAVVAESRVVCSLGLDTEPISAVRDDIWPQVCAPAELDLLGRLEPDGRQAAAALVFVSKEAFFKCQFPLAREWLDFTQVVVESEDWGAASGRFRLTPQRPIRLEAHFGPRAQGRLRMEGRFRRHDGYMTAGMALSASTPSRRERS